MSREATSIESPAFLASLRAGLAAAWSALLAALHGPLLRLARTFVPEAFAEEVVQETWVAVFEGLAGFQGRSSLRGWIFQILANRARTRGEREGRSRPFSSLAGAEGDDGPAVDPARFTASGGWSAPPVEADVQTPERLAADRQLVGHLARALEAVPEAQRTVVMLRDVEGLSAPEACAILGITETHQRVLLHRGRSRLRAALEQHLQGGG